MLQAGTYKAKDAQDVIQFADGEQFMQFITIQEEVDDQGVAYLPIDRLECQSGCDRSTMCGYPDVRYQDVDSSIVSYFDESLVPDLTSLKYNFELKLQEGTDQFDSFWWLTLNYKVTLPTSEIQFVNLYD